MFRIKICGITNIDDAQAAAQAGADAIGLNCFAGSQRFCPLDEARAIAGVVGRSMVKVGVFVDAPADEIRAVAEAVGLDLVQLHGDEPPELLRDLRPLPVLKAFRLCGDFSSVGPYLEACHRLVCLPRMVLVDVLSASQYGGTGKTLNWQALRDARREFAGAPLVLAGGLKPDNVAKAVRDARPWAVDTASGVETSPGKKSNELMRAFVAAANDALAHAARMRCHEPIRPRD